MRIVKDNHLRKGSCIQNHPGQKPGVGASRGYQPIPGRGGAVCQHHGRDTYVPVNSDDIDFLLWSDPWLSPAVWKNSGLRRNWLQSREARQCLKFFDRVAGSIVSEERTRGRGALRGKLAIIIEEDKSWWDNQKSCMRFR